MEESLIGFPRHDEDAASEADRFDAGEVGRCDPVVAELGACRQRLALTLAQVAERSGLAEPALRLWECGEASPPLDALHRWAAGLGLSLELARSASAAGAGYAIDWDCRRLVVQGKPVRLTRMEWNILERLAWTPGQLVTHRDLFRHLYGEEREDRAQATAIRVRISKLRQKVPFRIEARWGQGYIVEGVETPPRRSSPRPDEIDGIEPPRRRDVDRAVESQGRKNPREMTGLKFAVGNSERSRNGMHAVQALRMEAPVKRMSAPPPVPTKPAVRAEELGVIERFLAERGATRCPDPRMLAQAAVPALVWDKMKRKWVRPAAETCALGLAQ